MMDFPGGFLNNTKIMYPQGADFSEKGLGFACLNLGTMEYKSSKQTSRRGSTTDGDFLTSDDMLGSRLGDLNDDDKEYLVIAYFVKL